MHLLVMIPWNHSSKPPVGTVSFRDWVSLNHLTEAPLVPSFPYLISVRLKLNSMKKICDVTFQNQAFVAKQDAGLTILLRKNVNLIFIWYSFLFLCHSNLKLYWSKQAIVYLCAKSLKWESWNFTWFNRFGSIFKNYNCSLQYFKLSLFIF